MENTHQPPLREWLQRLVKLEQVHPGETFSEHARHIKEISTTRHYAVAISLSLMFVITAWTLCSVFLTKITVGSQMVGVRANDTVLTSIFKQQAAGYRLVLQRPDGTKKQYKLGE